MILRKEFEKLLKKQDKCFPIFIPSYKRWDFNDNKTLSKIISECSSIIQKRTFVFVRPEQYKRYNESFGAICNLIKLPEVNGLASTRQYMYEYARDVLKVKYYIDMDDDITNFNYVYYDDEAGKDCLSRKGEITPDQALCLASKIALKAFRQGCVFGGLHRQRFANNFPASQTAFYVNKGSTPRQVTFVNVVALNEYNVNRNMIFDQTGDDVGYVAEIAKKKLNFFQIPCIAYGFVDDAVNSVIRNDNNRRKLAEYEYDCLKKYPMGNEYLRISQKFDDGEYRFSDIDFQKYCKCCGIRSKKVLLSDVFDLEEVEVDGRDEKHDIGIKQNYASPRWSGEIADCSMPMTFDTYSNCSFGCVYCFSQFQRGLSSNNPDAYFSKEVRSVNPEKVKKIFTFEKESQFSEYVRQRKTFQWGGLSDQFDGFERKYGVTLDLLRFFKEQNYPICFSTKATWWLDDDRYVSLFKGQKNWNCKFSIITNDDKAASKIEVGVPSSTERIEAIRKYSKLCAGGATLRLRPFIIGVTSKNYIELIKRAHDAGANAVTTEFLCIENRAAAVPEIKKHYDVLSEECGFDILKFYNKYSYGTGYMRLNRKIKEPYIKKMQDLCAELGMRFYVSDAHFKEACDGSCCCGLSESWNYSRGNFSYALQLCKKNGSVRFSDILKDLSFLEGVEYNNAEAFNTGSTARRAKFTDMTMIDYLRYLWNNPNAGQSPCKMFEKVMYPDGYDENGDIIYKYNKDVTYVR